MMLKYKILALVLLPLLIVTLYHVYIYDSFINQVDYTRSSVISPAISDMRHATTLRYLTIKSFDTLDDLIDQLEIHGYNESVVASVTAGISDIRSQLAQRDSELQQLNASITSNYPNELQLLGNIIALINESESNTNDVLAQLQTRNITVGVVEELFFEEKAGVSTVKNSLVDRIDEFVTLQYNALDAANADLDKLERDNTNSLYYISIASTLFLLAVALFLNSRIVSPIEKITRAIDEMSKGNMNITITGKDRDDEIGMLARAFDRTLVSVKLALKKSGGDSES